MISVGTVLGRVVVRCSDKVTLRAKVLRGRRHYYPHFAHILFKFSLQAEILCGRKQRLALSIIITPLLVERSAWLR